MNNKKLGLIKLIVLMIICGFLTQIVASYLLTQILSLFPKVEGQYSETLDQMIKLEFLTVLVVCVLSPLLEELVFRWLILKNLAKVIPFAIANLFQALCFSVYHGNIVQGIYAFILGLFIGYLLFLTGKVFYTIVFHCAVNVSGFLVEMLIPKDTSTVVITIMATVSAVLLLLCLVSIKNLRYKVT